MEFREAFELIGILASGAAGISGVWWGFEKWRRRDEHFPRVYFEVNVNFLGIKNGDQLVELTATLENKGVVPLKIRNFTFRLLGIRSSDDLAKGGAEIRNQINFPHSLEEGLFVPENWDYTFVYPGIKTEYNFVSAIPADTEYVRMQGDFDYLTIGRSHHAAKVIKVPINPINPINQGQP